MNISLPTDLASARDAFARIAAMVHAGAAPAGEDRLIVDRVQGETGAYYMHRENGAAAWHITAWLESGDMQVWIDVPGGPSRFHGAVNVNTGKTTGALAQKAA